MCFVFEIFALTLFAAGSALDLQIAAVFKKVILNFLVSQFWRMLIAILIWTIIVFQQMALESEVSDHLNITKLLFYTAIIIASMFKKQFVGSKLHQASVYFAGPTFFEWTAIFVKAFLAFSIRV